MRNSYVILKNCLRALAYVPPALLWQRCSHPTMIPAWLGAPASSAIDEIPIALFQDVDVKQLEDYRLQLLTNHRFFEAVNERFTAVRGRRIVCEGWPELLYLLVRVGRPQVVIETGVFDGLSSSMILQGLHDNKTGKCVSIDLPATDIITDSTDRMPSQTLPVNSQPGWIVPEYLRSRHILLLGDSRELLPRTLQQYHHIEMFLHDSLHTYDHQMFEYEIAWGHLSNGGLLLSDDIFWSPAFHQFSKAQRHTYKRFGQFGVVRKSLVS